MVQILVFHVSIFIEYTEFTFVIEKLIEIIIKLFKIFVLQLLNYDFFI